MQRTETKTRPRALAAAAGLALLTPHALADLSYPNFSSAAGLQFVGDATLTGAVVQLTPAQSFRTGGLWAATRQDVASPFVCEFTIRVDGAADGMAFVIQDVGAGALGGDGGSLGYSGVPRSLAVEFDTFVNGEFADPSENHVSVHTRGAAGNTADHAASLGSSSLLVDLNDGAVHSVRIESGGGMLRVFVDDAVPVLQVEVDVATALGLASGEAWVGFTAATGGLSQRHLLQSWTFDEQAVPGPGNRPPVAPVVVAPSAGGASDPGFFTFQLAGYQDPDGDGHGCSDYELWTAQPVERVWSATCLGGAGLATAALADGTFVGSHTGQSALDPLRGYVARARFRDDSGDTFTESGPWTEVVFQTTVAGGLNALEVMDVQRLPRPRLEYAASGLEVELPTGAGARSRFVLETGGGVPVAAIEADGGAGNASPDLGALPAAEPVRVRIEGGVTGWRSTALDLVVFDEGCERTRILLPPLDVPPGGEAVFWISTNGATWVGDAAQSAPFFAVPARGPAAGWKVASGFQVDEVAGGLDLPVNLAFVPEPGDAPGDPFLYVTELYGQIKVVTNDGRVSVYADNLLNFAPNGMFPGQGEQGLGGLVVEPVTGDLFLSLLYDSNGPHYPRVERLSSADGGLTMATRTTVLDMPGEFQGQAHYVSHLELNGDGTMFVHMGDGFVTNTARDLTSFRGKILRMNLDGSAPSDNPFYTPGNDTARDYVWALGVRNPFGGRTREADGAHYFVDNGPGVDRFAQVVRGRDYLWNGTDASMQNFALHAWSPAVGPVNLAFVQPGTFGGSGFPAARMGNAYVSGAGNTYALGQQPRGKRIEEFVLDAQGGLVSGPTDLVEYVGAGRSTVVGLSAGPGGLYFTDLYPENGSDPTAGGARILRVRALEADGVDCGTLGTALCSPAQLNSTGQSARLLATGSDVVADDDLTLQARQLPPMTFGLLVASETPDLVPNVGGGVGTLCVGGTIGRFNGQVANSGAAGEIDLTVALGALPPPLGAVGVGDTWIFQLWYRDVQLVPTSNLTEARAVTFR